MKLLFSVFSCLLSQDTILYKTNKIKYKCRTYLSFTVNIEVVSTSQGFTLEYAGSCIIDLTICASKQYKF